MRTLTDRQKRAIDRLVIMRYQPTLGQNYTNGSVSVTIARKLAQGHMRVVVETNGDIRPPSTRNRAHTNQRTHA